MRSIRRLLGVLVMVAGILGLLLSLAGLVTIWAFKPQITSSLNATLDTLENSVSTSKNVMVITGQALGATVSSVDALSTVLSTTATTVEDTQPVMGQINAVMGDTLPQTLEAATDSLIAAQEAAEVMEASMQSLQNFQTMVSAMPLFRSLVVQPQKTVTAEKPLAESLGELVDNLADLPETFSDMSLNLDKADDNMVSIQTNLTTMSTSVNLISQSLREYQAMVEDSQSSMDNLQSILSGLKTNLPAVLNTTVAIFTLFFLWLLAVQVVILTQGLELYRGTATTMAAPEAEAKEAAAEERETEDDASEA